MQLNKRNLHCWKWWAPNLIRVVLLCTIVIQFCAVAGSRDTSRTECHIAVHSSCHQTRFLWSELVVYYNIMAKTDFNTHINNQISSLVYRYGSSSAFCWSVQSINFVQEPVYDIFDSRCTINCHCLLLFCSILCHIVWVYSDVDYNMLNCLNVCTM